MRLLALARAGWKLVYNGTPTETFRQDEEESGAISFDYSIGLRIEPDGTVQSVQWDGPAFKAGLSPGAKVLDVGGQPFSTRLLLAAVQSASSKPLRIRADTGGHKRVVDIDYRGGLRYPHLERIKGTPDRLSALLDAR